jgi:hypothetical protein
LFRKLSRPHHASILCGGLLCLLLNYNLILSSILLRFDLRQHCGAIVIKPLFFVLAEILILLPLLFLQVPQANCSDKGEHIEYRKNDRHDKPLVEHGICDFHLHIEHHVLLGSRDRRTGAAIHVSHEAIEHESVICYVYQITDFAILRLLKHVVGRWIESRSLHI